MMPLFVAVFEPNLHPLVMGVSYLNSVSCGVDLIGAILLIRQTPCAAQVKSVGHHSFWRRLNGIDPS